MQRHFRRKEVEELFDVRFISASQECDAKSRAASTKMKYIRRQFSIFSSGRNLTNYSLRRFLHSMFPCWSDPSVVPVAAVGPAPAAPPVVAAVAVAAAGAVAGAVAGAAAGSAARPLEKSKCG